MSLASEKPAERSRPFVDALKIVVQALILAFIIRSFLFQPYSIPSESMENTLLVGDYVFVSKFSYGYSRFALPFDLPLINGRLFAHQPERGDVAVFRKPK